MKLHATNENVFVIRDKEESEKAGILIPGRDRVKPHEGTIYSVGDLVADKRIKGGKNKKCLFHKGTGQEIEYNGIVYLVLDSRMVISVIE